jgi:hypothetical protein
MGAASNAARAINPLITIPILRPVHQQCAPWVEVTGSDGDWRMGFWGRRGRGRARRFRFCGGRGADMVARPRVAAARKRTLPGDEGRFWGRGAEQRFRFVGVAGRVRVCGIAGRKRRLSGGHGFLGAEAFLKIRTQFWGWSSGVGWGGGTPGFSGRGPEQRFRFVGVAGQVRVCGVAGRKRRLSGGHGFGGRGVFENSNPILGLEQRGRLGRRNARGFRGRGPEQRFQFVGVAERAGWPGPGAFLKFRTQFRRPERGFGLRGCVRGGAGRKRGRSEQGFWLRGLRSRAVGAANEGGRRNDGWFLETEGFLEIRT